MKRHPFSRCLVSLLLTCTTLRAAAATITWSGATSTNWGTNTNWTGGAIPGTGDTASFTDTKAETLPGEVTSVLNVDKTIGGLAFSNTTGKYHTLDLAAHTLTVTGNVNFNVNQGVTTTTTIRNGTLNINGAFANLNVARSISAGAVGVVDLTGLTAFNATLQDIQIGTSTSVLGNGTLNLPTQNSINAQRLLVGASFASQDTRGTLRLGANTTILANELHIGHDNSIGLIDVVNNATINIGTAVQRTLLEIGNQNTNTSNVYSGTLDLKNAAVNLHFDSVTVAQKTGGPGSTVGQLLGGGSGVAFIGDAGARGNWYVGNAIDGGSTTGTVDFSKLSTLTAYVNDFWVGRSASGTASGNVSLAATSTVDASNGILVGAGGGGSNGTLTLGKTANTLNTNQLVIGQDYASGLVKIAPGGSLTLGSVAQRAGLTIGSGTTNTGELYSGKLDLTGATFNGQLGTVTVGQKDLGPGSVIGTLVGGNAGSIQIGAPASLANFYVGRQLSGPGGATGVADLGGMAGLTAYLNTLSVGTAQTGGATGTLTLPATSTINASAAVIVGSNGNGTLNLGNTTTILTNQLTIGQDYANGTVTIPAGGTLNLGSPAQRTSVSIAVGTTNTNETYGGTMDLGNATFVAYLNNVTIGNKNPLPGNEYGSLTIGASAANRVEANAITLGGNQSTGVLNFGGGAMYAGSIARGIGTGTFNWTGGQLSVGTFGTPTLPFNLANTGTGTLAPGSAAVAIGTTTVNGSYTQGAAATTAIEIAGSTPGIGNDQLNVSGTATLAGTLSLKLLNGFTPAVGQSFLIATYGSRSGTFGFVAPPRLPQDVAFQMDYTTNATQLNVRMVAPVAQSWISTASTGTFGAAANWSGATTPGTTSDLTINNAAATAKTVSVATSTTVHRVSLQGSGAPVSLEVPQGIQLGVSNQLVVGPGATLTGGGQVLGDVVVGSPGAPLATLSPGAPVGTLTVARDLTQNAAGVFNTTIAGPAASGAFGRASVGGNATLGGTLQVNLGAYTPTPLESFQVLSFASRAGRFDSYANLDIPGPLVLAPVYSATDLRLIATLPGDATTNGSVNFDDLVLLAQNYNTSVAAGANWWQSGDFNVDGSVNFDDLVLLAQNYNSAVAGGATFDQDLARAFASVPEPAGLCAIGVALCGLIARRRQRPR
jgi:hypothetical protein